MTDPEIEILAQRVAAVLENREAIESPRFVTASELARILRVSRDFVYSHADRLGVIRLGTGPKARLRFLLDESLIDRLAALQPVRQDPLAVMPRMRAPVPAERLLPVSGKKGPVDWCAAGRDGDGHG